MPSLDGLPQPIDLHVHGGGDAQDDGGAVGRLVARLDGLGTDRAVLMCLDARELGDTVATWAGVQAQCAAADGRLLPAGAFDPRQLEDRTEAGIRAAVAALVDGGAVMFGEYVPNIAVDDPLNLAVFAAMEAAGLPVVIHISTSLGKGKYGLYDDPGLPRLEATLARFPDLVLVGHSQAFWSEIDAKVDPVGRGGYPKGPVTPGRVVELMRRFPQLHADLSGMSGRNALERDPTHAKAFLAEFGDRLLYATDLFPVAGPEPAQPAMLARFRTEGVVDDADLAKILRGNAERILRLCPKGAPD